MGSRIRLLLVLVAGVFGIVSCMMPVQDAYNGSAITGVESSRAVTTAGFDVNFSNWSSGSGYGSSQQSTDFGNVEWTDSYASRSTISSGLLKVQYPSGKYGTANTGRQFKVSLPSVNERYLEYTVKFDSTFDFGDNAAGTAKEGTHGRGGKLPGLAGGTAPTGGEASNGNGFSARLMWRDKDPTNGYASAGNGKAWLLMYLYYWDAGNNVIEGYMPLGAYQISKNTTYTIKERVKMNTGSKNKDGQLQVWVNGSSKLNLSNLNWADSAKCKVDKFYFSTFIGGGDSTWNLKTTSYTYFDNLKSW